MADVDVDTQVAEEPEAGAALADVPGAIGLDGSQFAQFPNKPEVVKVEPEPAPKPVVSDIDPATGALAEDASDPEEQGTAQADTYATGEAGKPKAEPKADEEPERPLWDKKRQQADQKAAEERKRREQAEARAQELEARLAELEKQVKSGGAKAEDAAEAELEALDLSNLEETDDYGDPDPVRVAVKKMAAHLTKLIGENRAMRDKLAKVESVDEAVKRLTAQQQKEADIKAYNALLDSACKGREHIRNALVKAINAQFKEEGYTADNLPSHKTMTWMVEALATRIAAATPAPTRRQVTTTKTEPAKPGVRVNYRAAPKITIGQTVQQYAYAHRNEILGK